MLLFCWASGPGRLARRDGEALALAPATLAAELGGHEPPLGNDDDWQDDLDDEEEDDLDAFERRLLDAFEEDELEPDYDEDGWDLPEDDEDEL